MTRWTAIVLSVLVAMAVGRVITDHFPPDYSKPSQPYRVSGTVGTTLHLSYADVRVTKIRLAKRLQSAGSVVAPGGRFLVIDATVRALKETAPYLGVYAEDSSGRHYYPDSRNGCPINFTPQVQMDWHVRLCVDMPADRLPGARFVIARGDDTNDDERCVMNADRLPEYRGISAEPALPVVEAQDCVRIAPYPDRIVRGQ